jgi:hypothetical protein
VHCERCHGKIVEPETFVELDVRGWRHGVPGAHGKKVYVHLHCILTVARS